MPYFSASDGAQIYYTDEGNGIPLLCLSGLTRNGRDFDYLVPHLPPLRLIRMDYRGRGKSDWTGAESYTVMQEGADALALLDHLGLESAAILGTSRGGLIGMYLAAVAPERLRGLILNDVGPVLDPLGISRIQEYIGQRPEARTHAAAAVALEHAMEGFDAPPSRWMEEARKHYVATEQGLDINYDPALRAAFQQAMEGPEVDAWPLFEACIGKPLALIRGANSDLLTQATADEMAERAPDMIYEEVPDRAHIPFLDEPEAVSAINRFLGLLI
ncbi:alpha/beta fold hydrolase [Pararhodobacter oceanensis]|uniref:Alpha/beta hydrolase n=1 Tax=Pararhodobacter oceanensis TaxID=2172121 RepID=A0A2T8HVS4_9RHOB|nr:alpha/beta hydrolase [Pararhodobacter oceanensis]PVH29549.1 alpha/beta hydrolase [Pararhodobacter oceanensis]